MSNRREFLKQLALGVTSLTILPSWTISNGIRIAPSDRIVLGFIGLGRQGVSDFHSFSHCPEVYVAGGCDVDKTKQLRFKRVVESWQKGKGVASRCDLYESYEELLNRKDIDAISIATPDHWHALTSIHSCEAGKHVYVQKPLAFTVREGLEITKAVRDNNRVLQVGSQQRSSEEFQKAIYLVKSGAIGQIKTIYARVGEPPTPLDLPKQAVPESLNWDKWLGPLNDPNIHYHPDLCPPISLDPKIDEKLWGAWRWYRETGNGYTADWGAHMFDIAQAAIGMDGSGPTEFIPKGYNNTPHLTMKYDNGVVMTEQEYREQGGQGVRFNGDNGWIEVGRGSINCSDPSLLERKEKHIGEGEYEISSSHMQNFIDAIKLGKDPIAPVEVGCSTNTLCCIANIATELERPVKWDPKLLSFGNDLEASNHRLYDYIYRKPYSL